MMEDQGVITDTLSKMESLLALAKQMQGSIRQQGYDELLQSSQEMLRIINEILPIGIQMQRKNIFLNTPACSRNIIFSLEEIMKLVPINREKAFSRITFELIPFIEDYKYDFYFFTTIFGNKAEEKRHYEKEFASMVANHFIDEAVKTQQYKYDVSIMVTAYNQLPYTKQCLESVFRYMPKGLNYELILVNNGSTDETQAYFESLNPTKLIHMRENIINSYIGIKDRVCEGRYLLDISNDVVVMANYLENLMTCIQSDPKIALVVPTTPGVGEIQCITRMDLSLQEGEEFAKQNNTSDASRWKSMTLLYNPIGLYRSDILLSSQGVGLWDKYFVNTAGGDDALSKRLVEKGYKIILAMDCYCYHFGRITRRPVYEVSSMDLLRRRFSQN